MSKKSKKQDTSQTKIFDNQKDYKTQRTIDGFDNFLTRIGLQNENSLSGGQYTFNLITRNRILLEAAYRGSWVVGAMIDCVSEDMTRAGINVMTNEDKNADLKDLYNKMSRLQISQSLCFGSKLGRLYGGAIGVIQIEGQRMDTPLNLDTVGKDQFKGIVNYDRWMINPVLTDVITSDPDMGLPKYYQLVTSPAQSEPSARTATNDIIVHHSRVIRNIGIELPFFQAITEMMWGESVLERVWDRLIAFDNATMSAGSLIDRANLRTIGVENLREILAAGGQAQDGLMAQFNMMRIMQVNEGLTLMDKNDTFAATAYTFAGLSDMMLQFGQQLAGASGIPLVRLFGQSPAGLSATGESDIRMYYDNIRAQQEARLRGPWDKILKIMWRSVFGQAPPSDLEFDFVPLWQTSQMDKANIAKINTTTIMGAYGDGLISQKTAMSELKEMSGDTGLFSNITDEEMNQADDKLKEIEPVTQLPGKEPAIKAEAAEAKKDEEPSKSKDSVKFKIVDAKNLDSKPLTLRGTIKKWFAR